MQDGTVVHEGGIVLQFGANVRDVQSAIDFQDEMGTLAILQSHIVIIAVSNMASSTSVAVAGGHGHRTLGVGEYRDGERGIWIQPV